MLLVRAVVVATALLTATGCAASGGVQAAGTPGSAGVPSGVASVAQVPDTPTPWWSSSCDWWGSRDDRPEYRNLSLAEAERRAAAQGAVTRLFAVDGRPVAAAEDYRENRVNLVVESGRVICAGIS